MKGSKVKQRSIYNFITSRPAQCRLYLTSRETSTSKNREISRRPFEASVRLAPHVDPLESTWRFVPSSNVRFVRWFDLSTVEGMNPSVLGGRG